MQVRFPWNFLPGGPTKSRRLSFVGIVEMYICQLGDIPKVKYDIGTEIICLQYSGHEPIKYRTPENGKHTYRYLRVESFLLALSKHDLKHSGTFF